jgi:acetyl-CoA carboxylase biotin carboxylase subunit
MRKVLIANRGEIAIRIARACRDLGTRSVAVYSTADQEALHVRLADENLCIGEAQASKSYLLIPRLLAAAELAGADAIHPGYGFLSEQADFAEMVERSGLIWVGPSSQAIRQLGNKLCAKALARELGIPVIPGSSEALQSVEQARQMAAELGYPVLLKTAMGGGGKGIRRVTHADEMERQWVAAAEESKAAVGIAQIYLEKELIRPRHVEVQILADRQGHCIALGERDCTVQRRRQKLLEECPSPHVDERLRSQLSDAARRLALAAGYSSAGTAEFLLDGDGSFYFMEFNSRIQVEHTVTELVTGVDLVEWQLRIARGDPLDIAQQDVRLQGHAIQARIVAEDSSRDFAPSPGVLGRVWWPQGTGIRVDAGVESGSRVPPHYDSLLGKVIAYGNSRQEALRRLTRALHELDIQGVHHLGLFLAEVVGREEFQRAHHLLGWLEQEVIPALTKPAHGEVTGPPLEVFETR